MDMHHELAQDNLSMIILVLALFVVLSDANDTFH